MHLERPPAQRPQTYEVLQLVRAHACVQDVASGWSGPQRAFHFVCHLER